MAKANRREDVEVRWYINGVYSETRLEKNRCIYRRRDGTEYISAFGNVTRDPNTNVLYAERRCIRGKAWSIKDVISKL